MTARLTRVKTKVTIHAHRKVLGLLSGEYAAVTSGRSLDFNDLREYVVGDDVKDIDWKATARAGTPLIKRYVAVRQHNVLLVASTGRSMAAMNDLALSKRDLAVTTAGVLAWLAISHGDQVAVVHGNAAEQHSIRAGSSAIHAERCLEAIDLATRLDGPPTDLAAVLAHVIRTVRRRSIAIVICDEVEITDAVADLLSRMTAQHEVLFVTLGDLDPATADLDRRELVDIDTGARVLRSAQGNAKVRAEVAAILAESRSVLRARLERAAVVHEHVHDEESAIAAIFRLLERHRHARRR